MKTTLLTILIISFSFVHGWGQSLQFGDLEKLPENINSPSEESMPILSPDGKTLFFVRTFFEGNHGGRLSGQDIWYVQKSEYGNWGIPSNNLFYLNNDRNNAVIGISQTGDTLYLLDSYNTTGTNINGISYSIKDGTTWKEPKKINLKGIEAINAFVGFYVSPDGKSIIVSMEGADSYGEEDLYIIQQDSLGKWSNPINLGPTINTKGYEISPYMSADGKYLYFSSDGHPGFGGADLFVAEKPYQSWLVWNAPINLGEKINSKNFEAYPYFSDEALYFVSNRDSQYSDIFSASVSVTKKTDLEANIQPNKYKLTEAELQKLFGVPISRYIYFEKGSSEIDQKYRELIYFLSNKIIDNPEYSLEIIGHASDEGSETYNENLSRRRAEAVADIFRNNGVPLSKVFTKGMGERDPLEINDSETANSRNRRVEIYFVK